MPPTKGVPATSTSKDMYGYWCTTERVSSILCQHHDLIAKMGRATAEDEKKSISEKIKSLLKTAAAPPSAPGAPRSPSPFSKEYSQMKMAFCSSNPPGAKLMCSTAASQYRTGGASSTKPSSASSSVTMAANEVWRPYYGYLLLRLYYTYYGSYLLSLLLRTTHLPLPTPRGVDLVLCQA